MDYDCIVIGGGHAGIEASLAVSRLGFSCLLVTQNPDNIGAEYITLDATATKTANARTVELRPNLRAWLDAYPFVKIKNNIVVINARTRLLCTEAGIKWKHDCLRHSFASYAHEVEKDPVKIASEMGHQGTKVFFTHYRALVMPGQGLKWFHIKP